MRRRQKEPGDPGAPPLELTRFEGLTFTEGKAWMDERMAWWDRTHPDRVGDLEWLIDGLKQVPDAPFCGGPDVRDSEIQGTYRADGTWCGNPECACAGFGL